MMCLGIVFFMILVLEIKLLACIYSFIIFTKFEILGSLLSSNIFTVLSSVITCILSLLGYPSLRILSPCFKSYFIWGDFY